MCGSNCPAATTGATDSKDELNMTVVELPRRGRPECARLFPDQVEAAGRLSGGPYLGSCYSLRVRCLW